MTDQLLYNDAIGSLADAEVEMLREQWQGLTRATQQKSKDDLRSAFESGIALVLGAGVSMDAGVPSWARLLSNIVLGIVHRKLEPGQPTSPYYQPFTSILERCLPSDPLVVAHYAELAHRDLGLPMQFVDLIRSELYVAAPAAPAKGALAAIANVVRGRAGQSARGVVHVVTYNFDTLLEEALAAQGCPVVAPARGRRAEGRDIPVYHPHGVVHRTPDVDDWTILAERDYHTEFATPHSWSNIIQLNAFSQMRCVFIGLSMSDPNLRRLLGAARPAQGAPHYVFLRRSQPDDLRDRIASQYKWASAGNPGEANTKALSERLLLACEGGDAAVHLTLRALGVETIWFDDFGELPGMISAMAQ